MVVFVGVNTPLKNSSLLLPCCEMSVVQLFKVVASACINVVLVSPIVPHWIPSTRLLRVQASIILIAPVVTCTPVPCGVLVASRPSKLEPMMLRRVLAPLAVTLTELALLNTKLQPTISVLLAPCPTMPLVLDSILDPNKRTAAPPSIRIPCPHSRNKLLNIKTCELVPVIEIPVFAGVTSREP